MEMTFEESVKVIRENMREGDAKKVADAAGYSKQVVFNALKKTSMAEMTTSERSVFAKLLEFLTNRIEIEKQTTNMAINLAAALTK